MRSSFESAVRDKAGKSVYVQPFTWRDGITERSYTCTKCNALLFVESSWHHHIGQVNRVSFGDSAYPKEGTLEEYEVNDIMTPRWRLQEIALGQLEDHMKEHKQTPTVGYH